MSVKKLNYKKIIQYIVAFNITLCIDLIAIKLIWNNTFIQRCLSKAMISILIQSFSLNKLFEFCTSWTILLFIISNGAYFFFSIVPNKVFNILHIDRKKQEDVTDISSVGDRKDDDMISVKELAKLCLTLIFTIFISIDFCILVCQTPLVLIVRDMLQNSDTLATFFGICFFGICICLCGYIVLTVISNIVKKYFFLF